MTVNKRPVTPVKPVAVELVFFYPCPFCMRELPMVSPSQPTMITCDVCRQSFPIVPIDEYTVHFIKLMLADGPAAVDPDYV